MKIGIAGISHLGLVTGICMTEKSQVVHFYDPDSARTVALAKGEWPVFEEGLEQLFLDHRDQISTSSEVGDIGSCDIIYIAQDVPTNVKNQSDTTPISQLIEQVLPVMKPESVLVIHSQVAPGFTRDMVNRFDSLIKEKLLTVYYQVETLVFGIAVKRALFPERYIVGCAAPERPLNSNYRKLLELFDCPILPMRYESAELSKLSINLFLVSSVMTSNMIAEVAEKIGADWNEIIPTLRMDKRIGPHAYLNAGLGIAGGNLERDLVGIQALAAQAGTESVLISAWEALNYYQKGWVLRTLRKVLPPNQVKPTIALWGLAYKMGTHSIKNAPSATLLNQLKHCEVKVYDPQVRLSNEEYSHAQQCSRAEECLSDADVLVILTPWPEFLTPSAIESLSQLKGKIVIDPFRCLDGQKLSSLGFSYYTLGTSEVRTKHG